MAGRWRKDAGAKWTGSVSDDIIIIGLNTFDGATGANLKRPRECSLGLDGDRLHP